MLYLLATEPALQPQQPTSQKLVEEIFIGVYFSRNAETIIIILKWESSGGVNKGNMPLFWGVKGSFDITGKIVKMSLK